jgi:hypothetical protein
LRRFIVAGLRASAYSPQPIKLEQFRLSAPFSLGQRSLKGGKPRFVLFEAPKRWRITSLADNLVKPARP